MLGNELRRVRERAGMSQEQLALKARVDRSYLSEIERNKKSPTVKMFLKLCKALGTSAAEIISRLERPAR